MTPPPRTQHPAPLFTRPLASLKAGAFSLAGQRGHPVLLSFLNTQAEATAGNDPSDAATGITGHQRRHERLRGPDRLHDRDA